MKVKVTGCARCGEDHEVGFMPLTRPSGDMTHWAQCPVLAEPILIKILPSEMTWQERAELAEKRLKKLLDYQPYQDTSVGTTTSGKVFFGFEGGQCMRMTPDQVQDFMVRLDRALKQIEAEGKRGAR